tara:strand:+ start:54 stop:461 length:408 start_codon:yes stop_codon:yes gene_type:complete
MIIICSNCKKQFKINPIQIPAKGRNLKCGSCNHIWFYKIEDKKTEPLPLEKGVIDNKDNSPVIENKILKNDKKKDNTSSKFFSYLVVSVISFVALIILVDTLKMPLIKVFPGLEIILFSLFEILKDIKLFIIDLY